jgi:hypothetical protein
VGSGVALEVMNPRVTLARELREAVCERQSDYAEALYEFSVALDFHEQERRGLESGIGRAEPDELLDAIGWNETAGSVLNRAADAFLYAVGSADNDYQVTLARALARFSEAKPD